jgi:hypothetical protein
MTDPTSGREPPPATPPVAISRQVHDIDIQRRMIDIGRKHTPAQFVTDQLEGLRHFCDANHFNFLELLRHAQHAYWESLRREGRHEGRAPDAEIYLSPEDWEDQSVQQDGAERLAWLQLNGTLNLHVQAIGVAPRARGEQHHAVRRSKNATLSLYARAAGNLDDGEVFRVLAMGVEHALVFMSPYMHSADEVD